MLVSLIKREDLDKLIRFRSKSKYLPECSVLRSEAGYKKGERIPKSYVEKGYVTQFCYQTGNIYTEMYVPERAIDPISGHRMSRV